MTISYLSSRGSSVTPKPTIATPVLTSKTAEKCIAEIDEDLNCLYCIAGTLAGTSGIPDEALEALMHLRHRMKRNIDILYTLG